MPEENSPLSHLSNLKAVEVSYVPRGANQKTFLILKEDEMPTIQERIAKTALKNKEQVAKVLKDAGLSPDDANALQGALAVLTSMGDQVSPELLGQLGGLCGVQMAAAAPAAPAAAAAAPAPAVPVQQAQPTAQAVHQPAPAEQPKPEHQPAPAAAAPAAPAPAAHQPAPATPAAAPAPAGHQPPPFVKKEDEEDGDEAGVMKADGSLDESKIPAPLRATVLKLWQKGKDLDAIKKQLDDERDVRVTKEYVEKASAFTHLPIQKDEFGLVLKELAVKAPTVYEKVEGVLKQANELIAKSGAFREIGATGAGAQPTGGRVTYEMIESAAMQMPIAKEQGMKKEVATTHFITKTAEGRKMYADYRAQPAASEAK